MNFISISLNINELFHSKVRINVDLFSQKGLNLKCQTMSYSDLYAPCNIFLAHDHLACIRIDGEWSRLVNIGSIAVKCRRGSYKLYAQNDGQSYSVISLFRLFEIDPQSSFFVSTRTLCTPRVIAILRFWPQT